MKKISSKKEAEYATEKVVNHQQMEYPKLKELKHLQSLPYTVGQDTIWINKDAIVFIG